MNYNVVCVLLQPVAYTLRKTERNSASFSFVARSSAGALAGASRVVVYHEGNHGRRREVLRAISPKMARPLG